MPKLRAPAGGHRDEAPEKAAAQNEVLAAKPIANEASERRAESIDPHECRADESELHFIEPKFAFQFWKDGKDRLPIGVVEEANEPEHEHNPPFVGWACWFHECRVFNLSAATRDRSRAAVVSKVRSTAINRHNSRDNHNRWTREFPAEFFFVAPIRCFCSLNDPGSRTFADGSDCTWPNSNSP